MTSTSLDRPVRRRSASVALLLWGAAVLSTFVASAPAAAATPRQRYSETFTTTRPGAPSGAYLHVVWLGERPGEKPHSITEDAFSLAPGATFDFSVPAVCSATDAALTAQGATACPKASEVATGEIDLDRGRAADGLPRIIKTQVTTFDGGPGQLISLAVTMNTKSPIRTIDRSTVTGTSIVSANPPLPGYGPPDKFIAVKRDVIHFLAISKGGHGFLTTPRTCPSSGAWVNRGVFRYHGGVTTLATSRSRCRSG